MIKVISLILFLSVLVQAEEPTNPEALDVIVKIDHPKLICKVTSYPGITAEQLQEFRENAGCESEE